MSSKKSLELNSSSIEWFVRKSLCFACFAFFACEARVAVELGWTRARAFSPRFGQDWMHFFCSGGLNELEILFDELNRCISSVRASWTNSDSCSTNWMKQTYLFVEHSIRISTPTKSSSWKINSRIDHQILFDELNWTNNSVRRINLSDQICSSPSSELARMLWS
jgi:hypothetical protein